MDDLFVYDDTISNHEMHLEFTLQKLCKNHLFLEEAKCNLFSSNMDCLGHLINDRHLHTDANKMDHICNWPMPKNLKDIQRFLGLV